MYCVEKAKRNYIIALLCATALLQAAVINGQESVVSLIDEAFKNHPKIKSIQTAVLSVQKQKHASLAFPAPSLMISFQNVRSNSINIIDDAIGNELELSQMFPIGKTSAAYQVFESEESLSQSGLQVYKAMLAKSISESYINLWFVNKKIFLFEQIVQTVETITSTNEALYLSGNTQTGRILLLLAEKYAWESDIAKLKSERRGILIELNTMIGRHDINKEIEPDSSSIASFLNETLTEQDDISQNSTLLQTDAIIETKQAIKNQFDKMLIPDIMLKVSVMRMPNGGFVTMNNFADLMNSKNVMGGIDWMYSLGISVTLPFAPWSIGQTFDLKQATEYSILSIQQERENLEREIKMKFASLVAKLQATNETLVNFKERILPAYEKSLQESITNISITVSGSMIVLENIKSLLEKRIAYLSTQVEYFTILINLKYFKS